MTRAALLEAAGAAKLAAVSAYARGDTASAAEHYRRAAQLEADALAALPSPSAETRVASLIEQCGCLLAAGDDAAGLRLWNDAVEVAVAMTHETIEALFSRVRPDVQRAAERSRVPKIPEGFVGMVRQR